MSESEWFGMLSDLIESGPSERKVRLLCCAFCRGIWHLFSDDRSRNAVEVAERYAEGAASEAELKAAGEKADEAADEAEDSDLAYFEKIALEGTSNAAAFAVEADAFHTAEWAAYAVAGSRAVDNQDDERRRLAAFNLEIESQARILRDIFGDTFRAGSDGPSQTGFFTMSKDG